MRKPANVARLHFKPTGFSPGPYPSAGFLPVSDMAFGNGDCFGLYWPLGREQQEPVVCEMLRAEARLRPTFSSVTRFINWRDTRRSKAERGGIEDLDCGACIFMEAKQQLKAGHLDAAVPLLQAACTALPDVSEYWSALAGQLRRQGKVEDSFHAAVQAYRANWAFGAPAGDVLDMLRAAVGHPAFAADPLVQGAADLTNRFGGGKGKPDYVVLRAAVDVYFQLGLPVAALQILQNYAYRMERETVNFCAQQNFNPKTWPGEFSALCLQYLGDDQRHMS